MEFMLDTNICIYIIKRKPPNVIERFYHSEVSRIGISAITLSELSYGISKSSNQGQNQVAMARFVAPLEILPYGDEAAAYYGDLRSHLEKQGAPIGSLDMLIAAHALSVDCTLVTNNEKEFRRIPNLKINSWVS